MNINQELQTLKDLQQSIVNSEVQSKKKKFQITILKVVGFFSMLLCFLFATALKEYQLVLVILGIIVGISLSVATLLTISLEHWSVHSQYLNLDKIKQRIEELESKFSH